MNSTSEQQTGNTGNGDSAQRAPAEAFEAAKQQVAELKAYAGQYVAAQMDRAKSSVRQMAIWAAVGVLALVAGVTTIVMMVVLLVGGLADLIGWALGGHPWAGDLIVGGAMLLILGGGIAGGLIYLKSASLNATVERYERRHRRQRIELGGHDAAQRSAQLASKTRQ